MKNRPLIIITMCYIIGIIWGIYYKKYIPFFYVVLLLISLYITLRNKQKIRIVLACVMSIIVSLTSITKYETIYLKYKNMNKEISAVGVVESLVKESEYYNTYILRINELNHEKCNKRFYLKVKKSNNTRLLKCGKIVIIRGEKEDVSTSRNFKGFSYYDYLKTKQVYGTIKAENVERTNNKSTNTYKMCITNKRNKKAEYLKKVIEVNHLPIAQALLLGDTSLIDNQQKELFSNANLSHILAISGMHVSYVILGLGYFLKKISNRKSKYFLIVFLIFFAQFTGASPSVLRAVIMACLTLIASLIHRKSDTLNNIAFSSLIILILNPYSLFNLGFQLSFLGTLGIVLFHSQIENKLRISLERLIIKNQIPIGLKLKIIIIKIIQILSVSISANILIIPVIIYNYNSFSLNFLLSNLLVTPILPVLIFSGYITLILPYTISFIPAKIFNFCIQIFLKISEISSSCLIFKIIIGTPPIHMILAMYGMIFAFYLKLHRKLFNAILCISIIFNILPGHLDNRLKIFFVDVGQGDCTLVVTPSGKTILIDGGGSESGDYDVGKNVLIPYLYDRQITKIDYLIFSHFDSDHAGGLLSVMENVKVKIAIIPVQVKGCDNYEKFCQLAKQKKIKVFVVQKTQIINIEKDLYFEALWPLRTDLIGENILNNNSLVCKMTYRKFSILFTGDIEEIAEKEVLNVYENNTGRLKADVLKVGHHGSKSSSTEEFIKVVKPSIALIGVGANNKFGHPSDLVIERFKSLRCTGL